MEEEKAISYSVKKICVLRTVFGLSLEGKIFYQAEMGKEGNWGRGNSSFKGI